MESFVFSTIAFSYSTVRLLSVQSSTIDMFRPSLLSAYQDFSTSFSYAGTVSCNDSSSVLAPKTCLVVRPETTLEELKAFSVLDGKAQSRVEHIFLMGVDLTESNSRLQLLEEIFASRKAKLRAVTIDRCNGPVDALLSKLLLFSSAAVENLTLNSLAISLPKSRNLQDGLQRRGCGIQRISFCGCQWTTRSVDHFLNGLKRNGSVHTIRFNGGKFDGESSATLANAIGSCQKIRRLELFSCDLSDQCAAKLVTSLLDIPNLEHLDLGRNSCHGASQVDIGKLLEKSTTLYSMNLALQESPTDENNIQRPLCLQLLCPSLQKNRSLKSLFLRGNRLDDKGMDALIETLVNENSLQRLMLTDCLISQTRMTRLLDQLINIKNLRTLWLDGVQDRRISSRVLLFDIARNSLQSRNTDLEVLKLPFGSGPAGQIEHWLDLNRGGRRLVYEHDTSRKAALVTSVWPIVLERVNNLFLSDAAPKLRFRRRQDNDGLTTEDCDVHRTRRANILYYFLRQKILLEQ